MTLCHVFKNLLFLLKFVFTVQKKNVGSIKIIRRISWSGIRLFLEGIRSYTGPKRDQSGPR